MDDCLAGMLIIQKYEPEATLFSQHEQVWFGDYEKTKKKMTPEEFKTLTDELNWFEDQQGWSHFT